MLCASVCRNDGKLGRVPVEASVDVPSDAPRDVQRFWKTVVKPLEPLEFEVTDVLPEPVLNA